MKDKEYFEEWLNYDRETGEFTWKKSPAFNIKPGDKAGHYDIKGYRRVALNGKKFLSHRLVWLFEYGEWPEGDLDHINRIPHDSRIENLRLANESQNNMNRDKQINNTSGFKGVYWHPGAVKWMAQIQKNNKVYHLGYFDDVAEAAEIYRNAAEFMFGEYNFTD